jgi:hypothetical protein
VNLDEQDRGYQDRGREGPDFAALLGSKDSGHEREGDSQLVPDHPVDGCVVEHRKLLIPSATDFVNRLSALPERRGVD